jgi:hypothetical protein
MSAIPFIRALQEIILAGEPAPVRKPEYQCSSMARASVSKTEDQGSIPCSGAKPSCRGCGGGGILPEGGSCNWCSEGNEWDGKIYGEDD